MNKAQFMAQLKQQLKHLPFDEVQNAVSYYEEYFNDAGAENEQSVLEELGSPNNIAAQIIGNYALKDMNNSPKTLKKGLSTVWTVILAVTAAPIALPLMLAFVMVALAVVLTLICVLLAFVVACVGICFSGIICIIAGVWLIISDFPTALFFGGLGMVASSIGCALSVATVKLSRKCFSFVAGKMSRFLLRRTSK